MELSVEDVSGNGDVKDTGGLSSSWYLAGVSSGISRELSDDELDGDDFFLSKRAYMLGRLGVDTSRGLSEEELLFLSSSWYLAGVLLGISRELSDEGGGNSFAIRA